MMSLAKGVVNLVEREIRFPGVVNNDASGCGQNVNVSHSLLTRFWWTWKWGRSAVLLTWSHCVLPATRTPLSSWSVSEAVKQVGFERLDCLFRLGFNLSIDLWQEACGSPFFVDILPHFTGPFYGQPLSGVEVTGLGLQPLSHTVSVGWPALGRLPCPLFDRADRPCFPLDVRSPPGWSQAQGHRQVVSHPSWLPLLWGHFCTLDTGLIYGSLSYRDQPPCLADALRALFGPLQDDLFLRGDCSSFSRAFSSHHYLFACRCCGYFKPLGLPVLCFFLPVLPPEPLIPLSAPLAFRLILSSRNPSFFLSFGLVFVVCHSFFQDSSLAFDFRLQFVYFSFVLFIYTPE